MFNQQLAFDDYFTAAHIAERLVSVSGNDVDNLSFFFEVHNFDVVGFCRKGQVIGYLENGNVDYSSALDLSVTAFDISEVITKNTPLMDCLKLLQDRPRLFVMDKTRVESIITKSDIQKAAVRMLFFGIITHFESEAAKLIQETYQQDGWKRFLKRERIQRAMDVYDGLIEKNQELNLINCTQFCDKTEILLKDRVLLHTYVGLSKSKADDLFERAERFRNDLAHAHPLTIWFEEKDVIGLADALKKMTAAMVLRKGL